MPTGTGPGTISPKAGIEEFTLSSTATGGTTYTQTLAPGCAVGTGIGRGARLVRLLGATGSAGLTKMGQRLFLAATVSISVALASRIRGYVTLAVAQGNTLGLGRLCGKLLTEPTPSGAAMAKALAKSFVVAAASSGAVWAMRVKTQALTCGAAMSSVFVRQANKRLAPGVVSSLVMARRIGKQVAAVPGLLVGLLTGNAHWITLTATAASAVVQTRQIGTKCAAFTTSQASQINAVAKSLAASGIALAKTAAGRLYVAVLSGASVTAAWMQKRAGKRLAPSLMAGVWATKGVARVLRTGVTGRAQSGRVMAYARALLAAQTARSAYSLTVGKIGLVSEPANVACSKAMARAMSASVSASVALAGVLARVVALIATCANRCGMAKANARALPTVMTAGAVSLVRQAGKAFAFVPGVVTGLARLPMKALASTSGTPALQAVGVGKALTVAALGMGGVFKAQARALLVGSASFAALARNILKTQIVSAVSTMSVRAGRVRSIVLAATSTAFASLSSRARARLVFLTQTGKRG